MKFFLTGHTGFKGAWLTVMLSELGHEVHGFAKEPLSGGLFKMANLGRTCNSDFRGDVRDLSLLTADIKKVQPDFVIHLAAQALVRQGHQDPEGTYSVNVNGTLNVLSAASRLESAPTVLIITTDKVYLNSGKTQGYIESDPLGGKDPYSASKAAADLLSQSWSWAHPEIPIAIARGGNVIGGGDVSQDRIVPDTLASISRGGIVRVRNPDHIRPWQYVLDCLNGYMFLLRSNNSGVFRGSWNIGPSQSSVHSVSDLVNGVLHRWGSGSWESEDDANAPEEQGLLLLDSSKAKIKLGWENVFSFDNTLDAIVRWEKSIQVGQNPEALARQEVRAFLETLEAR